MTIPDLISPIIGYRVWQWDGSRIASLNVQPWLAGRAMEATCNLGRPHQAPQTDCTCGIYAVKTAEQLYRMSSGGIFGEVYLWGTVVEHELGWRAQFAYPKNLILPFEITRRTGWRIWPMISESRAFEQISGWRRAGMIAEASHLQALLNYGVDLFIDNSKERIPLWKKGSGFESTGLDYMQKVASGLAEQPTMSDVNHLSKRERRVVELVAEGLSNREIETCLGLSQHTVKNLLSRIYDKLGLSNRVELVLFQANLTRKESAPWQRSSAYPLLS
jgi:DNA-binding CsgD family transcriptional regulator